MEEKSFKNEKKSRLNTLVNAAVGGLIGSLAVGLVGVHASPADSYIVESPKVGRKSQITSWTNKVKGKKGYLLSYDVEDEFGIVDGKVDVKIPFLECDGRLDESFGFYDLRKNMFYYTGVIKSIDGKHGHSHPYQEIENPKKPIFKYAPDCP